MTDQEDKMICVCDRIKCPFGVKENGSFGCQEYSVAPYCHLLQAEDGSARTALKNSSTQYYLYSYPGKVDLAELAQQNAKFLARPEVIEDWEIEADFEHADNCYSEIALATIAFGTMRDQCYSR